MDADLVEPGPNVRDPEPSFADRTGIPVVVLEHVLRAETEQAPAAPRQAWQETDHAKALDQPKRLAVELEHEHPGAAASLREGMEETLTVTRLGITGKLKRTLQSTNPCELMIGTVRTIQRNVKNWSSGEMCLRWTAAGMLEAETRFRKVEGHRGLAQLAIHIETDLIKRRHQLQPS
jgi:putative transposase